MRIAFISAGFYADGDGNTSATQNDSTHIYIHNVATNLVALGHEVEGFAPPQSQQEVLPYPLHPVGSPFMPPKTPVHFVRAELCYSWSVLQAVKKLHKERSYDILQLFSVMFPFLAFAIGADQALPPMVFTHGGPVQAEEGDSAKERVGFFPTNWHVSKPMTWGSLLLLSYVLKKVPRIIVGGEMLKDVMVKSFQLQPEKVVFIRNAVDSDMFRPDIDCSDLRDEYETAGRSVIGCVARVAPYKNQMGILRAMPEILGRIPDAKLLLVGPLVHAPYVHELDTFIQLHRLEESVVIAGPVPYHRLPHYYNLFDIFVLLSTAEGGTTYALLEAMSSGKSFVVSDIPQLREAVRESEVGDFVGPFDEKGVAAAVVKSLTDSHLRARRGQAARETVLRHFDWKQAASQVTDVYCQVLGRAVPSA